MINKKFIALGAGLLVFSVAAKADMYQAGPDSQVSVELSNFDLNDDTLVVGFNVKANGVKMPSKMKTVFQPMMVNGNDTACFPNFAVDGRKRWEHEAGVNNAVFQGWGGKKSGALLAQGNGAMVTAANGGYNVQLAMPYNEWMGDAFLVLDVQNWGCTVCLPLENVVNEQFYTLAQADFLPLIFEPQLQYLTPTAEELKQRDLTSHAYLDFKVNQTNILPNYMNNPKELKKIKATIDSINSDADVNVTSIHIKGFASPEGPYENNVRLAKGRTEALKNYLVKDYKLSKDFITTSWDPAINWEGLREWLNNNEIENKAAILDIVNSDLADVERNNKIKNTYPTQYNYLLKNVYPSLRVSDYTLNFEVKAYDTVEEILTVMEESPNKLSVAEIFLAGSSNGVDSDLFEESVMVAVNTYPNDAEANLNAGILSMQKGDLAAAAKYLAKAGDSDSAKLARAQLDALNGQNEKALKAFKELSKSSNAQIAASAAAGAASVERILRRKK